MTTAPAPKSAPAPALTSRIRLVPCPADRQVALDDGLELLAAIGRRVRAETPARSGVVVIFFLLWVVAMGAGTALGLRTPHTVAAVEHRWHGPAHEHPADYAADYVRRGAK